MIKRYLQLPRNKHIFLFGPRQTGKSTLIQSTYTQQASLFYDLLHSETYRRLQSNPEVIRGEIHAAVEQGKTHVVIDEVQKVPQLLDEVHALIESNLPVHFILSGSSSRKLKRSHANMLGGRAWTLNLFPFIVQEISGSFDLNEVLRFGALPGVYSEAEPYGKSEILRSYVETYIKEEIETEADIRHLGSFLRFLPILAAQNGEVVNYANIARETAVQSKLVREYFKIIEDTLLGFFLLPYGKSLRKKMTKHPKFYFFDTGVVRALTQKLTVPVLEHTYEYGRAFEQFFICELMRLNNYKRMDLTFSFYRTEAGAEVDCIIESPTGKIFAIEIKSTSIPTRKHCRGLRSFKQKVPEAELLIACLTPRLARLQDDVLAMPWKQVLEHVCCH